MAIVTGGINGPFKGKVGSVFGYTMMGKDIIRSCRKKTAKNKRGSVAQNASRSKFTKMQKFLHPILHFIRVGFNMEAHSKQISAHNAAKSYNMLNAFSAEGEIDYSKVLVTYGNLAGAVDATVVKDDIGLHFTWTDNSEQRVVRSDDQVMLLAYNPQNGIEKCLLSGARRNAGQDTLELSKFKSALEMHTWIAFISDDRQRISMSTYVGLI